LAFRPAGSFRLNSPAEFLAASGGISVLWAMPEGLEGTAPPMPLDTQARPASVAHFILGYTTAMPRPRHEASDQMRRVVTELAAVGLRQQQIAHVAGVDVKT
jgi:hypothetical protein